MRYYPFESPSITTQQGDKARKAKKSYYVKKIKPVVEEKVKTEHYVDKVLYLETLANPKGYKRSNYSIEQITNKLEQHGKK